ncbi:MAG: hypothetical protein ACE5DX_00220 [Candidatus Dojkabacteria bacterium]
MAKQLHNLLLGKHFGIETTLVDHKDSGYKLKNATLFRIPQYLTPKHLDDSETIGRDIIYANDADTWGTKLSARYMIVPNQSSSVEISQLSQVLDRKLAVIELTFDYIKITSDSDDVMIPFDGEQLSLTKSVRKLAKDMGLSNSKLTSALINAPVVATDVLSKVFNARLLMQILRSQSIQLLEFEQVIFTGEMVWSRWVDISGILAIFELIFAGRKVEILIDFNAIFQLLLMSELKIKELSRLNGELLKPQVTWIDDRSLLTKNRKLHELDLKKKGGEKKLILTKDRIGLFDLRESGYKLAGREITRYIYINVFVSVARLVDSANTKKYEQAWVQPLEWDSQYANVKYWPLPRLWVDESQHMLSQSDFSSYSLDLNKGSKVSDNQDFGKYTSSTMTVFNYQSHAGEIKSHLQVNDHQHVKKGSRLTIVPTLGGVWDKYLTAPHDGRIDLRLIDDGIILLKVDEEKALNFRFPMHISNKLKSGGFVFKATSLNFPLAQWSGRQVSGYLASSVTEVDSGQKIIIMDDVSEFDLSIEKIFERQIAAILFRRSSRNSYVNFIKSNIRQLKVLSFGLLTGFEEKMEAEIKLKLEEYLGEFALIDRGALSIPLNVSRSKFVMGNSDDTRQLSFSLKDFTGQLCKGETIKVFSYLDTEAYVRIEKVHSDSDALGVNSTGAFDFNIINSQPLILRYGTD